MITSPVIYFRSLCALLELYDAAFAIIYIYGAMPAVCRHNIRLIRCISFFLSKFIYFIFLAAASMLIAFFDFAIAYALYIRRDCRRILAGRNYEALDAHSAFILYFIFTSFHADGVAIARESWRLMYTVVMPHAARFS